MRFFLLLFVLIYQLFSSIDLYEYDTKEIKILRSFDIDESFLSDSGYIKLKESLQNQRKSIFIKRLKDGYRVVPILRQKIKEAGLPESFLYLAMAESGFLLKAYSKKRASGLWQFMPRTGKRYGLKMDVYVDERRDIIKSTEAAITYLGKLYDYYGKWYLAILSYNCGEGRVAEAIVRSSIDKYVGDDRKKRQSREVKRLKSYLKKLKKGRIYISTIVNKTEELLGVNVELKDILKVQKKVRRQYLPKESRRYIRKIVAYATMANKLNYLVDYNLDQALNYGQSLAIAQIKIKGGTHLSYIADSCGMSLSDLRELNGHLKYSLTPTYKDKYSVYIPYDKLADFKKNFDPKVVKNRYYIHRVTKGDNLIYIGKKYGINYRIIKSYNNLKSNFLSLNQKLIIPILDRVGQNEFSEKSYSYIVKRGDTISSISRRYQTTINKILKDNNLPQDGSIKIGDRLVIN